MTRHALTIVWAHLSANALLCASLLATSAHAATWYVYADGSGDAPTIQAAIELATTGDVVRVGPGVYTDLHPDSRGVTTVVELKAGVRVESIEGPALTIIDADLEAGDRRGVSAWDADGAALVGFTVRKGNLYTGAGVYLYQSDVLVEKNRLLDNYSGEGCGLTVSGDGGAVIRENLIADNIACCGPGGGILVNFGAAPLIERNVLRGNSSFTGGAVSCIDGGVVWVRENLMRENVSLSGGGIAVFNTPAVVEENWILDNSADEGGGISCWNAGAASFRWNVIARNLSNGSGGGYFLTSCSPSITSESLVRNSASIGAGIFCWMGSSPLLDRLIVASNIGAEGIYTDDPESQPLVSCTDAFGNEYGDYGGFLSDLTGVNGNVSVDPGFCDLERGSYFLSDTSPVRKGGCGVLGARDERCPALGLLSGLAEGDELPVGIPSKGGRGHGDPAGAGDPAPNGEASGANLTAAPNPSTASVTLALPAGVWAGSDEVDGVTVHVHDALGRTVARAERSGASWTWDGMDATGRVVARGSYWALATRDGHRVASAHLLRR